jgi:predicted DNA helicase
MPRAEDQLARDRRLLELEEAAELAIWKDAHTQGLKALEQEGLAIRGLLAREDRGGPLGRTWITFERTYGAERGGSRLGAGDPVLVRQQNDPENTEVRALIRRLTSRTIELVFEDVPEPWVQETLVACEVAPNDVTFARLRAGIGAMDKAEGATRALRDELFGLRELRSHTVHAQPQREGLNALQSAALDVIAAGPPLFLLHGPPGTGKTTTVARAIAEAVARGERVLVGTPSNQALDNVAHALLALAVPIVRLGNPARAHESLWPHTLEGRLEAHAHNAIAKDLFAEARKLFREAAQKKSKGRALDANQQAYELRGEAKRLLGEAKQLEGQALRDVLTHTPVVLSTLTGMRDDWLADQRFSLGVIDEATQALGPAVYPLLARVERVVFAGDHRQLGPTVISTKAVGEGIARSWFERLMERRGSPPQTRQALPQVMLREQYRMHPAIMAFPSRMLYEGALVAAANVSPLADEPPLLFIDTAGRGFDEEQADASSSYYNSGEAELARSLAERLSASGASVGLLSPYAGQVQKLRELCEDLPVEVNTIDGFQGREKDVIIVSLVRSNERQEIGFLSDVRRMNVALTRARQALIVIGDSATLAGHPFYGELVDHVIAENAHRSAWDFAQ